LRLALGTVQFGLPYGIANKQGQVRPEEASAMLQLAESYDIDTLDTAIAYGESESILGKIGLHDFKLVTKLPPMPDDCQDVNEWIHHQISASFRRLALNTVYGLLLHRPDQLLGPNGQDIFRALQKIKKSGRVQKIGISIYDPIELDTLVPRYRFDLVQAPFNLIDRRLHTTRWLQRHKQNEIEIHTRSVFLQGLLLMSRSQIPIRFERWAALWNRWHDWLDEGRATAVQACLAYPLSFTEIDRIVVGADSVSQLKQIIDAGNFDFQDEFIDLQSEAEELINPSLWNQT
jgi:aryl-alcohol dehydrogenase-like predicted oxidoreductase